MVIYPRAFPETISGTEHSDTAGIRLTSDKIEKEGVLRSREVVKISDLVLFISDVTEGYDADLYKELLELQSPERIVKIMNKIDLQE